MDLFDNINTNTLDDNLTNKIKEGIDKDILSMFIKHIEHNVKYLSFYDLNKSKITYYTIYGHSYGIKLDGILISVININYYNIDIKLNIFNEQTNFYILKFFNDLYIKYNININKITFNYINGIKNYILPTPELSISSNKSDNIINDNIINNFPCITLYDNTSNIISPYICFSDISFNNIDEFIEFIYNLYVKYKYILTFNGYSIYIDNKPLIYYYKDAYYNIHKDPGILDYILCSQSSTFMKHNVEYIDINLNKVNLQQ